MTELALADLLPLWRTVREQDVTALITPALDYVGAIEITGLDVRFAGDDEIATAGEGFRRFTGSLEDASTLLFLYRVQRDLEPSVADYEAVAANAKPQALHSYVTARAEWLRSQPFQRARTFLFFSRSLTSGGPLSRGVLGAKMMFVSSTRLSLDGHTRQLQDLAQLRDRIMGRLQALRVDSRELDIKELWQLHYELLNPDRAQSGLTCPDVQLRDNLWNKATVGAEGAHLREYTEAEQLAHEDIEEERDYFRQGRVFRRTATLKVLPEDGTDYFASEKLLSLTTPGASAEPKRFAFTLAVAVQVQPQARTKWVLNTQHGLVDALKNAIPFLSQASIGKAAADDAKQRSIADLFTELSEMSSKLVTLSATVLLEATTLSELDAHTEAARAAFNAVGNSELLVESVAQVPAFLSMLPGSGPYQVRRKACTSRNAGDFLPVFAPWAGCSKASSLFPTPNGDLLRLDLFDKKLSQVHHLLGVADSGSGKSMGAGALLIDALASGVDAILVDNGNSWRRLTQLFGGIHVPVDLKTSISPFASFAGMLDERSELDNEAIQQVVRFIEVCVADKSLGGFDKPQADLVGRAVRRCYLERFGSQPAQRPLISDFRHYIAHPQSKHPDDLRISEMVSRRLGMFCDGLYADFLNRPSDLRLDSKLLTFDLAGVSKDPILKPIAVAALMEAVGARAAARSNRAIVAIDEAHEFLTDDVAAKYVAGWYRKMRKYDVAMWSLTQRFSDFLNCPVGPAIEGNAGIKFFLRHGSGHELISSYFKFSRRTDAAFRQLQFKGGHYSDLLLLYGQTTATVRLALHPLAYWILTTDPEDTRLIDRAQLKNPHLDQFALLQELAARYPHGADRHRSAAA